LIVDNILPTFEQSSQSSGLLTGVKKEHTCNECSATFSKPSALKHHLHIHSDNKQTFVCNICSQQFAEYCLLKQHKRVHS